MCILWNGIYTIMREKSNEGNVKFINIDEGENMAIALED